MMIDFRILIDENEKQRMLQEGYLPEVIEWHAKERFNQMQADFRRKDGILKMFYEQRSYYEFVADVFPNLERLMVITGETTYTEMDIDELMEYQSCRADVYVAPASFINGCYSSACCKDLYAFVVDIDRIEPDTLKAIIENKNLGMMTPMPTYIINSGNGVHFYYVFDTPVPHYFRNQPVLKDMYRTLCSTTSKNILAKTDWHAITQPFRLPGTLTKLGQLVTAWKCGAKWTPVELGKRLGVPASTLDLQVRPLLSQHEFNAEKERRAALMEAQSEIAAMSDQTKKKKKGRKPWVSSLEGKTGFYLSCLQRCYEKTPEGTRYRSMMALTVVARKCGYPKEQLEHDLNMLLVHYSKIGKHMKQAEVKKALRMYTEKALKTKSETLEQWFGWGFPRIGEMLKERQKEKGKTTRSKSEIWERARKIRDIDYPNGSWRNKSGAPSKQQEIRWWRVEHPDGTPKECIKDTGISKNTVYKWWNTEDKA